MYIMSGFFIWENQSQAFDHLAVFPSRAHNIDPGGIDAAVAQNIRKLGNVLIQIIKSSGKQLPEIVGKYFLHCHVGPLAQPLHPGPNAAPV